MAEDNQYKDRSTDGHEEAELHSEGKEEMPYMELFFSEKAAAAEAVTPFTDDEISTDPMPPEQDSMDDELPAEVLNAMIEDICQSKADEFRMIGYEHVTGQEVWECVSSKYMKQGVPPLHRIVNDIYSLKVTSFMNWMTMSIYKDTP